MTLIEPIRVANVVFDERLGGPQRRIVLVARDLASRGIGTELVKPVGGLETESLAASHGVATTSLEMQKPTGLLSPLGLLKYASGVVRDLRLFTRAFNDLDVDVVHVNGAFFVAPAIAARLARKSLVWHLNDTMLPRPVAKALGLVVKALATEVVAAAAAVADYYGVTEEASIIHAPVDVKRFSPSEEIAERSVRSVGILGNWASIKGYDRYVRVLAGLSSTLPVRGLAIGGYPESQAEYRSTVLSSANELGVLDKIEDHGFVADPSSLIREMDVLVLTSRSEASPTCVLEAMASGVPVVAFDVGGVREMLGVSATGTLGECGSVVAEGDVDAMVREVQRVLCDHGLRASLSKAGVLRAGEHFSVEACARRHRAVYSKAIGVVE